MTGILYHAAMIFYRVENAALKEMTPRLTNTTNQRPHLLMKPDFENKVILITGASSGIGEATARLLAGKGAKVLLGARRTDRLEKIVAEIRAAGGSAECRTLDVTSLDDTKAFAAFAKEKFGPIDVLINNAGIMPLSPLHELKIDEWNRMIDVNIRGVLHGIAAVLPDMRARKSGHIINSRPSAAIRSGPHARFTVARNSPSLPFRRGCAWKTKKFASPSSRRESWSLNSPTLSPMRQPARQ